MKSSLIIMNIIMIIVMVIIMIIDTQSSLLCKGRLDEDLWGVYL